MLVIREMLYFMFALFLLCVLMCLVIFSGWLLNTLCTELLDIDVISLMKLGKKKPLPPYTEYKGDWDEYQKEKKKNEGKNL